MLEHPQQLLLDNLIAFDQRQKYLNIFQWIHSDPVVVIQLYHQSMRVSDQEECNRRGIEATGIDFAIEPFDDFLDAGGNDIGKRISIRRKSFIVCDRDNEPELIEAVRDMVHLHRI